MNFFDKTFESFSRSRAQKLSRKSFLNKAGKLLFGISIVPLLPIDRISASSSKKKKATETDCDYWRFCALDGFLCTCCNGGITTCPAGTQQSPTTWVGTCLNPEDKKQYLISYNDCCGKDSCGKCICTNTERELPIYRAQLNNDILWCFGAESMSYHCTVAAVVGKK